MHLLILVYTKLNGIIILVRIETDKIVGCMRARGVNRIIVPVLNI